MSDSNFSDLERKALEVFVTSATDKIYACRYDIPPEVFGAFGSFFSRNPKDFRNHLLDAIYGRVKGYEESKDVGEERIRQLAEGHFNSPHQALQSGVMKSRGFFKEMYGQYSHKSIANVVWIPFVANNVSQLFMKQLAYDQLAFFIEQSTRYVDFDEDNLYLDKDVINSNHSEVFYDSLRFSTAAYKRSVQLSLEYYQKKIPFDSWLTTQDDKVRKFDERLQKIKYNRELKGKVFDVSRLFLPQAMKTNVAWIADARSTEFNIAGWKGHPLNEIRDNAFLIERAGGQIAPSLLKYTDTNSYHTDQYSGFGKNLEVDLNQIEMTKGVNIISYDPDALNKSLVMLLSRVNRSGDFANYYSYVNSLSFSEKIDILKRVTENRGSRDEWVDVEEAFDCISITAEIISDIGAIRDLRRHQKWDRNEGIYTLDNGFYSPEIINEIGIFKLYEETMGKAHDAELKVRSDFPYAAQYLIPMGTNHSIIMRGGLDQFQYLVATRTTPDGHFSYRKDAYNLAEAVCKIYPWMLGLEKYPEDKTFEQVYFDAPLKGILRPYIGETGLHR